MPKSEKPTDAPEAAPVPDAPATTGLAPEEYMTEQEKGGADPVSPAVEPTKADPVDIGPREPYPTGGRYAEEGVPENTTPPNEKGEP